MTGPGLQGNRAMERLALPVSTGGCLPGTRTSQLVEPPSMLDTQGSLRSTKPTQPASPCQREHAGRPFRGTRVLSLRARGGRADYSSRLRDGPTRGRARTPGFGTVAPPIEYLILYIIYFKYIFN